MEFNTRPILIRILYSLYVIIPFYIFTIMGLIKGSVNLFIIILISWGLVGISFLMLLKFGSTKKIVIDSATISLTKNNVEYKFINNVTTTIQKVITPKSFFIGYCIYNNEIKQYFWKGEFKKKDWINIESNIQELKIKKHQKITRNPF